MVSEIWTHWSEILSNPWQLGVTVYVIIGLCVVGFVSFSGMRLRNPPRGGILWDEKDNVRNTLFTYLAVGKLHPIGVLIEIALWPLRLILIIIYYEK